jgi:hypothetical protein
MAGPLSYPEVEVFAGEYLARTKNTSIMVALSVLHTEDLAARTECVKNLYSEYGNGDPAKAHLVLLEGFLADLLSRLRGVAVPIEHLRARQPLEWCPRSSIPVCGLRWCAQTRGVTWKTGTQVPPALTLIRAVGDSRQMQPWAVEANKNGSVLS